MGKAGGKAECKAEGKAEAIGAILSQRFPERFPAERLALLSADMLDQILRKSLTAISVADALGNAMPANGPHPRHNPWGMRRDVR
jgi:hypothetical protein